MWVGLGVPRNDSRVVIVRGNKKGGGIRHPLFCLSQAGELIPGVS